MALISVLNLYDDEFRTYRRLLRGYRVRDPIGARTFAEMFAALLFYLKNTEKIAKLEFRTEKDSGSNLGQDAG